VSQNQARIIINSGQSPLRLSRYQIQGLVELRHSYALDYLKDGRAAHDEDEES